MKLKTAALISVVAFGLPTLVLANDESELKNQSNQKDGYYLVQENIWTKKGCVEEPKEGKQKVMPGESAKLKMKEGCKWGVVKYEVFKMSDHKKVGDIAHTYRGGKFFIEMQKTCEGNTCNFDETIVHPEK
jgi:hypothetical protein